MDTKIIEQSNRISAVTEVFKDALMLSNKTYFLEQVHKHKLEKKSLKKDLQIVKDKLKLLELSNKELLAQNWELENQIKQSSSRAKFT